MSNRVYLKHDVTGGTTEVPDDEDVLRDFALRGWHPARRPQNVPFIPAPDGLGPVYLNPADYTPADETPAQVAKPRTRKD